MELYERFSHTLFFKQFDDGEFIDPILTHGKDVNPAYVKGELREVITRCGRRIFPPVAQHGDETSPHTTTENMLSS